MRVLLDDREIAVEPPSIAKAIELARGEAEASGRVIIEATGDGAPLDDATLDDPPHDAGGVGELRFGTADLASLVSVTMTDAAEALESARGLQREAAERIESGSVDTAYEPMQQAVRLWQAVGQAASRGAALAGIEMAALAVVGDTTGAACVEKLEASLAELRRALNEEDWSGVSDALLFDLDGAADTWAALLAAIRERVTNNA